ncbi:MAG: nitrate/nitrite transporter NarK [Haloarculaceae archaeon]|jgi:nitrate/nitrite transporter NarK
MTGPNRQAGKRGRWGCLAGAWLLSLAANAFLIVPASLIPPMMETFGTGPALTVWVVTIAFATWALSSIAVGVAIDRVGDFTVAATATALIAVTGVWGWQAGLSANFLLLLASRAVAGVAIGAVWTTGANLVGRAFADRMQGTALGIFTTSAPAGLALGQSLGPLVHASWGWPVAFLGFAIATLAGFGVFAVGYVRTDFVSVERSVPSLTELLRVARRPTVAYGSALGFLAYSLFLFFNSWMPTYIAEEFALSLSGSSLFVALFPAVGIVSRAGGGLVSDRLLGSRRRPIVRWSFFVTAPLVVAVSLTSDVALLVVLLVAAGFVVQLSIGILYSYVRESVGKKRAGTALSLLVTTSMTGAFLAPVVTGWLIEQTASYDAAFLFATVLAAVGVVLAWLAPVE